MVITFRRLTRADFPMLAIWLSEPHNRRWWAHDPAAAAIERDFGPSIDGTDAAEVYLAYDAAGAAFGLVQHYPWTAYPDEAAKLAPVVQLGAGDVGIDYLVGSQYATGRGLGTAMITAISERLLAAHGDARIVVAVAAGNVASQRVLERSGFALGGPAHLTPDNPIDPTDHLVYLRGNGAR